MEFSGWYDQDIIRKSYLAKLTTQELKDELIKRENDENRQCKDSELAGSGDSVVGVSGEEAG